MEEKVETFSEAIFHEAASLLEASRSLDYNGIIKSDKAAVAQLNAVLQRLSIDTAGSDETLDQYAAKQVNTAASEPEHASIGSIDITGDVIDESDEQTAEQRRAELTAVLSVDGMSDRLGKVYNSFASDRVLNFEQVPHQRGLPPFDIVVAADFAPIPGLHGIFISEDEVMSVILASDPGEHAQWEVLKSRVYSSTDEMMEYVTLLSTGFELP